MGLPTPAESEQERQVLLEETELKYPDLKERFAPKSFGCFEVYDRINVATQTWGDFVANHPAIILNEEAFHKASLIEALMIELHEVMASDVF